MRAFQYLNSLDIEQAEGLGLGAGKVAVVNIDGYRSFRNICIVVLHHTADIEDSALAADVAGQGDAGRECDQVGAGLDPQRIHLFPAEGSDSHAYVVDILLPFLGRDNDFLQCRSAGAWHHEGQNI